jgi:hypothetical protein
MLLRTSHKWIHANKTDMTETNVKRRSAMKNIAPGFSTAFRVLRGASGLWVVMEEGCSRALAVFEAPQAALSFACSIAEAKNGALQVEFAAPPRTKSTARYAYGHAGSSPAYAGQAS